MPAISRSRCGSGHTSVFEIYREYVLISAYDGFVALLDTTHKIVTLTDFQKIEIREESPVYLVIYDKKSSSF